MTTGDKGMTVVNVEEREDGGATYTFEVPDEMAQVCGEYGLKLLMYCGVLGQSPECVFKSLEREIQNLVDLTTKEDIRPMTDEERQRAKEKEEANRK